MPRSFNLRRTVRKASSPPNDGLTVYSYTAYGEAVISSGLKSGLMARICAWISLCSRAIFSAAGLNFHTPISQTASKPASLILSHCSSGIFAKVTGRFNCVSSRFNQERVFISKICGFVLIIDFPSYFYSTFAPACKHLALQAATLCAE